MTREKIDKLLATVFAGVFQKPIDIMRPLTRESLEGWDSLKHMEIVLALEAATGIVFSEEEIAGVTSIEDLRRKMDIGHEA